MGRARGGLQAANSLDAFANVLRPRGNRAKTAAAAPSASGPDDAEADNSNLDGAFAATFGTDRGQSAEQKLQEALASGDDKRLIAAAHNSRPALLNAVADAIGARSQAGELDFVELRELMRATDGQPADEAAPVWRSLEQAVLHAARRQPTSYEHYEDSTSRSGKVLMIMDALGRAEQMPNLPAALHEDGVFDLETVAAWAKNDPDLTQPGQQEVMAAFQERLTEFHPAVMMHLLERGTVPRPGGPLEFYRDLVAERLRTGDGDMHTEVWRWVGHLHHAAQRSQTASPSGSTQQPYERVLDSTLLAALHDSPPVSCGFSNARLLAEHVLNNTPISVCAAKDLTSTINDWVNLNEKERWRQSNEMFEFEEVPVMFQMLARQRDQLQTDDDWSAFADALVRLEAHQFAAEVRTAVGGKRSEDDGLGGAQANQEQYLHLRQLATATLTQELRSGTSRDPAGAAAAQLLEPMVQSLAQLSKESGPDAFRYLAPDRRIEPLLKHYQDRRFLPDRNVAKDLTVADWEELYRSRFEGTSRADRSANHRFPVDWVWDNMDRFLAKKYDCKTMLQTQKDDELRRRARVSGRANDRSGGRGF